MELIMICSGIIDNHNILTNKIMPNNGKRFNPENTTIGRFEKELNG